MKKLLAIMLVFMLLLLSSCMYSRKDIQDLMEDELVDEFLIVSLYLEGEEYTRSEARDAFETIVDTLNKMY